MEKMDIDYADPEWTVSTDFHNHDDSLLVDLDYVIYCVRSRPFVIEVHFNEMPDVRPLLSFALVDKNDLERTLVRCETHRNEDLMGKSDLKTFPLIIHSDLGEPYKISYSENGTVNISFPTDRQYHRVPLALMCCKECLRCDTGIVISGVRNEEVARLYDIEIFNSLDQFQIGIERVVRAHIGNQHSPVIDQFLMKFLNADLSKFVMKHVISSLVEALKGNIPDALELLNQVLGEYRRSIDYQDVSIHQRFEPESPRAILAASPGSSSYNSDLSHSESISSSHGDLVQE